MIDVVKVLKAVAYAYDNADDGGFPPLKKVCELFNLSDEESDATWEMLNELVPKLAKRYDSF